MTVATNRQNTSIVLVEVATVFVAVFASSVVAVAGSDQKAFANKHEGNKDGQIISQNDGNRSVQYIIICQTTGTNSPITDHSCNNQFTDGNGVPLIIPLVFG
jgi:hypothetical protein